MPQASDVAICGNVAQVIPSKMFFPKKQTKPLQLLDLYALGFCWKDVTALKNLNVHNVRMDMQGWEV